MMSVERSQENGTSSDGVASTSSSAMPNVLADAQATPPALKGLLLYGVVAIILGCLLVWAVNATLGSATFILCGFLVALLFASEIGVYVILGGFGYLVFNPLADGWGFFSAPRLTSIDCWVAFLFLAFAATCFRYLELAKYHRIMAAVERPFIFSVVRGRIPKVAFRGNFLGGRWWLIPIVMFVAIYLIAATAQPRALAREVWITPLGTRIILLFGFMFLVWILSCGVIALLARVRLDGEQASVQARSIIAAELWREHASFESRQRKLRGSK